VTGYASRAPAVPLAELAARIGGLVDAGAFPDDPPLVYVPSPRPVARIGFALEPAPGLAAWVDAQHLDAIFLHRPWGVEDAGLPSDVGILASHAAFDHRLTIGANPDLLFALEMHDVQPLGGGAGGARGMVGSVGVADPAAWIARFEAMFGGVEEVVPGDAAAIRRIAVVGAMTDALVRKAAALGADLYLTGQIRHRARPALGETGMAAVAIGHRRTEEYGLRLLADSLASAFPGRLSTIIRP
jgi:putative NIF3 family GTP cyclohydrolase 1 type 2